MTDDETLAPGLEPLTPILGHWRSSGVVRGDDTRIEGTDTYTALPAGSGSRTTSTSGWGRSASSPTS
jgi:hypothetical protein